MAGLREILRTDFETVETREGLHRIQAWLTGTGGSAPLLTDGGHLVGTLDTRAITSKRVEPDAKLSRFATITPPIAASMALESAAKRMRDLSATYLAVAEKDKAVGYVTAVDVLRALGNGPNARAAAEVEPLMREDDTIGRAQHHLRSRDSVLPVVDAKGRIVGALRWTALARLAISAGHSHGRRDFHGEMQLAANDEVKAVAENTPIIVNADTPFPALLDVVEKNGYAFVEGGRGAYVGVVTPTSLLKATH